MVHMNIEFINQDNWNNLDVNFGKCILDNSKLDKIVKGIAKDSYLEQSVTLFEK